MWWLDGHSAKPIGSVAAYGGEFTHSSFVSHSWFLWPEATEGRVLGKGAALGEITISRVGAEHVLVLEPRCLKGVASYLLKLLTYLSYLLTW